MSQAGLMHEGERVARRSSESSLADADDATLAQALIARDPLAPRFLWDRYAPMVYRMMRRSMGPDHELDDLVQDVFLCVFDKIRTLREPRALKAFVISVTVLTARHEFRRRWVRRWVRLAGKNGTPAEVESFTPDTDAREALARFYRLLDRFSPRDRTAFVLRFMEGLELTEVAAALGLSLATTKRHLSRVWAKVALLVDRDPLLAQYRPQLVNEKKS
jgi:RNA polymerase sigma-70 factor, ECF subfamily